MRFTELKPKFVTTGTPRQGMGVDFLCPCCLPREERWVVWFANPIDGGAPLPPQPNSKNHRWQREGETFDTMTLRPSVNLFVGEQGKEGFEQHWHGFITAGEVR